MTPVIEIATFQASAALRADPTLLIPALDIVSQANGFLNAYHGFQVEDGTVVFLVIAWKNFAARDAFKASYEHSTIIEQLEPARMGPIDTLYVDAHGDHALSALENSRTQLVVCKLREGVRSRPLQVKSRVDAIVDSILGASEEIHPPSTYVKTVDIPKACYVAVGWDTLQTSQSDTEKESSAVGTCLPRYDEVVYLTVVHVAFKKFER